MRYNTKKKHEKTEKRQTTEKNEKRKKKAEEAFWLRGVPDLIMYWSFFSI